MKINSILGVTALVLLGLSLLSYKVSTTRAERFERGQKFLTQLNPDSISGIEITNSGDTISLKRSGDQFVVASKDNYPAKNEAINRLISDVLAIGLEKKIGSSESLAKELEVEPGSASATVVALKDGSDKKMVEFLLGKSLEGGTGRYLKRMDGEDQAIYLSSGAVTISTSDDSFLNKEILNVGVDKVVRVEGLNFVIAKQENGPLTLEGIPAGMQENATEVSQITNGLNYLRFEKVFLADQPEVAGLQFAKPVKFLLDDQSGYALFLAQKGETHYMKIQGTFDVGQIQIGRDETEEELKEKSEILSRSEELQKFNSLHGSWVYEISESTAKKFLKTKNQLLEDPKAKEAE